MIRRLIVTLMPLILVSAAWALDEPKDKADPPAKSETVAEKLKSLQQELQKTRTEILAKLRKAEKDEEKAELQKEYLGLGWKFAKSYSTGRTKPEGPGCGPGGWPWS